MNIMGLTSTSTPTPPRPTPTPYRTPLLLILLQLATISNTKTKSPKSLLQVSIFTQKFHSRSPSRSNPFQPHWKKKSIFTIKSSNFYTFSRQKLQSVHFSSSSPVFLFILLPESRIRSILGLLLQISTDLLAAGLLV